MRPDARQVPPPRRHCQRPVLVGVDAGPAVGAGAAEEGLADIDAPRKQKWLEIAARFPSMPPEERQRIQERMTEWARMTPEERGRARLQFQEARQISPQERQARWDAYLALPAEERRALANSATHGAEGRHGRHPQPAGEPSADSASARRATSSPTPSSRRRPKPSRPPWCRPSPAPAPR